MPQRTMVTFGSSYADLADFEGFSQRAKDAGATHIGLAASLPWSYWQYDQPDDPYPSWVITKCGLLKVATPEPLRKYVPAEHGRQVLEILQARCAVLRKLGLKGAFSTFDPSMLPEAVFADHPLWRGARVDHPARSRVARFAPTIDHPEVLEFYRQAAAILIRRCPEIAILQITTNDSGAGLDWSPGLYNGRFGNTLYRDRPMDQRIIAFFQALRAGAQDAGGALEVRIALTREPEPQRVAAKLERGMAIENLEGPGATPFQAAAGVSDGYGSVFHPVHSIPRPLQLIEALGQARRNAAPRLNISFDDHANRDLYFDIYGRFARATVDDPAEQLAFLKELAVARIGLEKAGDLLRIWVAVHEVTRDLRLLNTGGFIFNLGCVQQRWLTRPFVPFPGELTEEEKGYFRRFQFQALDEEYANSLSDVQATDVYGGWSGRHFVRRVLEPVEARIKETAALARGIGDESLARRFEVFNCIVRNARGAVSYQAQLDRVKQLGIRPLAHSVVGSTPDWDRQLMMETARAELDNTAVLLELLGNHPGEFLVLAKTAQEEDIGLLGLDIVEHLKMKLKLMNAKWEDYKRVFTTPNW